MSPPPAPADSPHLLDLSPSDTLPDHAVLPPTNVKAQLHVPADVPGGPSTAPSDAEIPHDYPDRSTYQQLKDTTESSNGEAQKAPTEQKPAEPVLLPSEGIELIPAGEGDEEEESEFDIEAIKLQYRRSGTLAQRGGRGYVRRDISVVRREGNEPPLKLIRRSEFS